jgi:hypothetical protein
MGYTSWPSGPLIGVWSLSGPSAKAAGTVMAKLATSITNNTAKTAKNLRNIFVSPFCLVKLFALRGRIMYSRMQRPLGVA